MVTGANSGVGLVSARELARQGWSVLLVCRDPVRGSAALEEVRAAASGPPPELLLADFASLDDVRALAEEYRQLVVGLLHRREAWQVADTVTRIDDPATPASC